MNIPHLSECVKVTREMMVETGQTSISLELSRRLQEELFDHFFSKYRYIYTRAATNSSCWYPDICLVTKKCCHNLFLVIYQMLAHRFVVTNCCRCL